MNTDDYHHSPTLLNDLIVFSVTVALCSFFLTASVTLSRSARLSSGVSPILALPQPPATLELAQESETDRPDSWLSAKGTVRTKPFTVGPDGVLPEPHLPFHGIITQVAGRYEIDPSLIRAIIFAESGYNPKAKSEKGARGLMQLMPSTAKAFGVQDIYDPKQNIEGGVRYFRTLLDRYDGDVQLALAAYNAGSRHVEVYAGVPPFKATRRYIQKVLKFQQKFKKGNKTADQRRLA